MAYNAENEIYNKDARDRRRAMRLRRAQNTYMQRLEREVAKSQVETGRVQKKKTLTQKESLRAFRRAQSLAMRSARARDSFELKLKAIGSTESDVLYAIAIIIAIFDDILDLTVVATFPGISFILSFIFGMSVFVNVYIASAFEGDTSVSRRMTRYMLIVAVWFIEAIGIGLNLLPIGTMTMIFLYYRVRKRREVLREKQKSEVVIFTA